MVESDAKLGHQFNIPPLSKRFDELQDSDIQKLDESLGIIREEPEQLPFRLEEKEEIKEEEQTDKARIQTTIDKFKELLKAGEQMKILLKKKLEHRVVRVDPEKNPAVRDAIRRVFGVDSDTVTYDMFEKALEVRSALIKEGRSTYVAHDPDA